MNPLTLTIGLFCFAALAITGSPVFWWGVGLFIALLAARIWADFFA